MGDCSLIQSRLFQDLLGQNVLQILKCAICLEFYQVPVILPCGHTFCFNCLLEMGKHASRNRPHIALQNITIGCPNCRCNIYVIALMNRDITLNYPIQSLIEGLRSRDVPLTVDESCGTEEETPEPEKTSNEQAEEAFQEISRDLDRLLESLKGGSVVDDAFLAIEEIRSNHIKELKASSPLKRNSASGGGPCSLAPPVERKISMKPNAHMRPPELFAETMGPRSPMDASLVFRGLPSKDEEVNSGFSVRMSGRVNASWRVRQKAEPGLLLLEQTQDRNRNNATPITRLSTPSSLAPTPTCPSQTAVVGGNFHPRMDLQNGGVPGNFYAPGFPGRNTQNARGWGRRPGRFQQHPRAGNYSHADPAIVSFSLPQGHPEHDARYQSKRGNNVSMFDRRGLPLQMC